MNYTIDQSHLKSNLATKKTGLVARYRTSLVAVGGKAKRLLPLSLCLGALMLGSSWAGTPIASSSASGPAPVLPLKNFFATPVKTSFHLSDDGSWLSWMQPAMGDDVTAPQRQNIFVQALQGSALVGEPRQLTRESARDIAGYAWKGSNTLVYSKDFGGDENFHMVAVDVATGQMRDLTPFDGIRAAAVDELANDADHILLQHNQRDRQVMDVYRVHIRTGEQTLVALNPGNIMGWLTDHEGKVRMAVASDGVNRKVLYRATESDKFKPIIETDFRVSVSPLFFDFDNRSVFMQSNRGRDREALVKIDPARPNEETLVWEHPQVDLGSTGYSRRRKVLLTAEYVADKPGRHFFDSTARNLYETLEKRLPGYQVVVISSTRDEKKFIVATWSDRTLGARYLYDVPTDSLHKLMDLSTQLPEHQMAAMTPVRYRARDGLEIPAYLTLPVGRPAKDLACIIHPHGGPWARDTWGFNPEVQFLANRGYCVLQMNFRGSTGYGRQFWEASFRQWGLKMQDDVTDGAKWLVEQGIADPKRLGIYGASYGGYATLAGITFTPDLYAAAVDYVGVSNMFTFLKSIPPYWEPLRQQMYTMVGNPDDPKDKARFEATSPSLHADKIKTPLLVAQGAKDPRVNKDESDQMVEALRKRGVTVQYLVKENEGHGFHNEENRFEFYGAMEDFFGKHLKP